MSSRVFLADNQDVFRAGLARILATEDDVSIVGQCDDLARLYKAAESTRAVIAFSSSLKPDLDRLVQLVRTSNNPLISILDSGESPQRYLNLGVQGIVYREIRRDDLLKCFRNVIKGRPFLQQPTGASSVAYETDLVGEKVRGRLSRKELQILQLLLRGYKNRDIAQELNNTEQVIKNYLRAIFDKTGTSDRLELVLFTVHHRLLLEAVEASALGSSAPSASRSTDTFAAGPAARRVMSPEDRVTIQ